MEIGSGENGCKVEVSVIEVARLLSKLQDSLRSDVGSWLWAWFDLW